MKFKKAAGLHPIGHIGGAACQTAKACEDPLFSPVTGKPVLVAHIRKEAVEPVGEEAGVGGQLFVSTPGEGGQVGMGWECQRVSRQEMVEGDIGQGRGVKSVIGSEIGLCAAGSGMTVGKGIDGPVEGDPGPDGRGIIEFSLSFYKVADQISRYDVRDVE